jgi:hypothetical protein
MDPNRRLLFGGVTFPLPEKVVWYGSPKDGFYKIVETYEVKENEIIVHRWIHLKAPMTILVGVYDVSNVVGSGESSDP